MKLNLRAEEFRRSKLLGKYIAKLLFRWNNRKFKNKYLKKLEFTLLYFTFNLRLRV